jgi:hypothetical protein
MNPPPILRPGSVAQVFNANGTVDPSTLVPGAVADLVFSLPLPAGFTISSTSEWMVTLPPGFTLPTPGSGSGVNFFGLAPYAYNALCSPPSTMGPITAPIDDFPAGTLWVWSSLNNASQYSGITLQFILQHVVNPTATGVTGSIQVQIDGTGSTVCFFTVPGIAIASS